MERLGYHVSKERWKNLLDVGLREDGWEWDWSTGACGVSSKVDSFSGSFVAKDSGVWVGEGLLAAAMEWAPSCEYKVRVQEGQWVEKGQELARVMGPPREVLALERPILNVMGFVSGIATQTRAYFCEIQRVAQGHGLSAPRLTPTRKTLPGFREVSIYASTVGGAYPHRISLAGGVLLKENHLSLAGGVSRAVRAARSYAPHLMGIEVEVQCQDQVEEAVEAGATVIMLDNFSPKEVEFSAGWIKAQAPGIWVEVSGNLTLGKLSSYVLPGVDVLSVGSLTHSVQNLDMSFLAHHAPTS